MSEDEKKHGYGILDWLDDSFLSRLIKVSNRLLTPIIVLGALYGYFTDLGDKRDARDTEVWQLLTTQASGNSGKIEALQYLNKDNPLTFPSPRRWGIPLGPAVKEGDKNYWFVIFEDFGPWKKRNSLVGIDLSRKKDENLFEQKRETVWTAAPPYLERVQLEDAILTGANFSGADLAEANLSGAKLRAANLSGADLTQTDLIDAELVKANLSGGLFWGADFSGAHLREADLTAADLRGANLASTKDLMQVQIDQACVDGATILPKTLMVPRPCQFRNGKVTLDQSGKPIRLQDSAIGGQDIIAVTDQIVRDILATPQISGHARPPRILMDSENYDNQSAQRINKDLLIDRLKVQLQRASQGRLQFVGQEYASLLEKQRQLKRSGTTDVGTTKLTRTTAGVDYILVGRINSFDSTSAAGEQERYTQISFNLLDAENSLSVWTNMYEFKKAGMDDVIYR